MTSVDLMPPWDLGEIPFQIGARPRPTNHPYPDALPFVVGLDQRSGFLVQIRNDAVAAHLQGAYRDGGQLGTPVGDWGLGKSYGEDFLAFVVEALAARLEGLEILEIGCGAGYLLHRLRQMGARVSGVEPDQTCARAARAAGLEVVNSEFDECAFDRKFDVIVHHNVLEHMTEPERFLRAQIGLLKSRGLIALAVPDEAASIEQGHLSMLYHQHWAYFSRETITALARSVGAHVLSSRPSSVGAVLHVLLTPGGPSAGDDAPVRSHPFGRAARRALAAFERYVDERIARQESIGIYVPSRALSYVYMLGCDVSRLRFFDDNSQLHGRFLPPLNIPVESREQLFESPVENLLVMSRPFGETIRSFVRAERRMAATRVTLFSELLEAGERELAERTR